MQGAILTDCVDGTMFRITPKRWKIEFSDTNLSSETFLTFRLNASDND